MSLTFPQFGNPDYGGFTTDEELARRIIQPDARQSPLITTQMPPEPELSQRPAPPPEVPRAHAPRVEKPPTVSEAVARVLQSRPETILDWVIIFILIIAAVCFLEYAHDFFVPTSCFGASARAGGNFCSDCGGTI